MPAVHQFAASLAPHDAVSDHVFALRSLFRSWGYESQVYAAEIRRGVEALPYRKLFRSCSPGDLLLLHFSTGHEAYLQLARLPARRVLVYHNVTPPEYFDGLNTHAALQARQGLRQLASLAAHVELAVGVSAFNRRALEAAGFERTAIVPVLIEWSRYDVKPDPRIASSWTGPGALLLFVGRIAPHKRQDDLVRLLAYYRRCVDPDARLVLVGGYRDQPEYHEELRSLARELAVVDAVILTGSVSLPALVACYRRASCFVSLSEHEGFGVPLLEAMRFGVPVVAYDAGAVGETVEGGGLVLKERDLPTIAETCALVLERDGLRERLRAAGQRRVENFSTERVAARTREVLGL